jgi:hypothetical protein
MTSSTPAYAVENRTDRDVLAGYARGLSAADLAARSGRLPEQVAALLGQVGYSRTRAAEVVRRYDQAHGQTRPAGVDVALIRDAIRAEVEPLAAAVARAADKVVVNGPAPAPAGPNLDDIAKIVRAELLDLVDQIAAAAQPSRATVIDPDRVIDRFRAEWCPQCGGRYRHGDPGHPCGPLTPITVTITRDGPP